MKASKIVNFLESRNIFFDGNSNNRFCYVESSNVYIVGFSQVAELISDQFGISKSEATKALRLIHEKAKKTEIHNLTFCGDLSKYQSSIQTSHN